MGRHLRQAVVTDVYHGDRPLGGGRLIDGVQADAKAADDPALRELCDQVSIDAGANMDDGVRLRQLRRRSVPSEDVPASRARGQAFDVEIVEQAIQDEDVFWGQR